MADYNLGISGQCSLQSYIVRDEYGVINIEKSKKIFQDSVSDTHISYCHPSKGLILDNKRCGYFSVSPEASEQMLKSQIASIKSLWDLSGFQKNRRFNDILHKSNLIANDQFFDY